MAKKTFITLIVIGIILVLLLLWGFAVPHYACKKCDFQFWGKYYSKDTCTTECAKKSPNGGLGATLGSDKRHFCANVNHTNTDGETYNYRICAPCKNGVKYAVDDNGQIISEPCDENNSYSSEEECKQCQQPSKLNDRHCNDRNLNCTQPVTHQYVDDYLTYTTPLYYTSPYCDYCSYNNCTNCHIPCHNNCCPGCAPSGSPITPPSPPGSPITSSSTPSPSPTFPKLSPLALPKLAPISIPLSFPPKPPTKPLKFAPLPRLRPKLPPKLPPQQLRPKLSSTTITT